MKKVAIVALSAVLLSGCAQVLKVNENIVPANEYYSQIPHTPISVSKNDITAEKAKLILQDKKNSIKEIKEKERISKNYQAYQEEVKRQEEEKRIAEEKRKFEEEQKRIQEEAEKIKQEAQKVEEEIQEKKEEQQSPQETTQQAVTQDLSTKSYTQPFSTYNNQEVTVGDYVTSGNGLHVENLRGTGTNGCSVYYSKITGKEPQITMGSAFSVPAMANSVGATVAINAGMGYSNGGVYYAYGTLYHGYSGHQSGDTLCLRNNGWLDDCWIDSNNVTNLGLKWAVKGLNCYTYNGQRTGYADVGTNPYSFIAQDYSGAYYIGAFSSANFSVMHNTLKNLIPNIKLMYATEGGGMVKYVENGNLIFNGRNQNGRYSNAMIWF